MEQKINTPCLIGITGKIGSGKTTVSNILREYGYYVFDTDLFSKNILTQDKMLIKKLESIVGKSIKYGQKVDLKEVGKFFERNPKLEQEFDNWYQAFLGKKLLQEVSILQNRERIIFLDIPLLHKKDIANQLDYLWIIEADEKECYQRIRLRNNYSDEKINKLICESIIDKDLLLSNTIIINNTNSIEELQRVIKAELNRLNIKNY